MKAKYTLYIVSRDENHHRPVLMNRNGKVTLNEPVTRARKLEDTWDRLVAAVFAGEADCVRITEKEFKKLYPKFAKNAGAKKATKKR